MIYLRTGLPGASKTLNSLKELVSGHDSDRPYFYNNVKLLMLDMEVAKSFSGWYYGWYFPRLTDKAQKRKLIKIMKPIHDEGDFVTLADVPWLETLFDSHDHFSTWLYWVKRCYPVKKLVKLDRVLEAAGDSDVDKFEMVRSLNFHFTHFSDPRNWMELPKRSIIFIDECQQFFPPRAVGSKVPPAIGALETHRHGGYDIHFVTQDRTLCDANLRKLVGCHVHYFNAFGGSQVTRKESPKCFNPDDYHDSKQAKKKSISRDKKFYGVYWSAEIHTHKFKIPFMVYVMIFFIGLLIFCIYSFSSKFLFGDSSTDTPVEQVAPAGQPAPKTTDEFNPQNILLELLTDVYISGSVTEHRHAGKDIFYSFVRTSDSAVFYPESIGLVVEDISPCLVNLRLGDMTQPVTCNPFYVREVIEDDEDIDDIQGHLASNEDAERFQPNITLF
ncbi:zonular occludens toxin domain-containing protein [Vibrio scophthalmi]|uniref:Zonular occludens toxin n=1 Tax=Vibrio scophthalmi LMG 19158 TaxID=870967 RepID=F9RNY8_9VIBR|nr:zonular occludens toxin domain-containing protein [Vibrio scophthalmi]EGU36426.1 zonular occludens toxin [Vibrio scophthalmi LMG 19158]